MTGEQMGEFRERVFPGKMSKEWMATVFGVKYHTLRRYEGENPNAIPEVLANSIKFYDELLKLKGKK
jgi:hypothetical protein